MTGTGIGSGSRAHGPSLSGLCTFNSLLQAGHSHTSPHSRGQVWAVLKPGRQLCSSRCSPWQWDSGNTALVLPHLHSCTWPDWGSCTRASSQDTARPQWSLALHRGHICIWGWASPDSAFPGPKRAFLGSMCIQDPPWVPFHWPPQHQVSTQQQPWPWYHSPHTPKSSSLQAGEVPSKAASSAPPPPQCPWQRHTWDRKDTVGPGAWGMLLCRGISAQQGEAAMSLLGDGYQQPLGNVLCHTQVSS